MFRKDFWGLGGVVIFRSIDNPTPSQPKIVRPTLKSFELRKTQQHVEVGAFSQLIGRELSAVTPISRGAETKAALSLPP
ncbi:MAG TPA: hypothetical protein V6D14_25305 [Coleofasciculaceae cyanobacterium]